MCLKTNGGQHVSELMLLTFNLSFKISIVGFNGLCNDEGTRTFLTMEIGAGHKEVRLIFLAAY